MTRSEEFGSRIGSTLKLIAMNNISDDNLHEAPLIDDAQWLAMQFVLGELTEEQSERFQLAMTGDVSLCEAVVEATRLTAGISLACGLERVPSSPVVLTTMPSSRVESVRPVYSRAIVLGAMIVMAMSVLAVVTLQNSLRSASSIAAADGTATAEALAMLLKNDGTNYANNDYDEWIVSDDSISSLVAPGWLLTAVDLDAASESDDLPAVNPNDELGIY